MKKIIFILIFALTTVIYTAPSFAEETEDPSVLDLKQPAYRIGTTDELEKRYSTVDTLSPKNNPVYAVAVSKHSTPYSYAESNLKMLSNEVSQEISMDSDKMFEDMSILWDGAVRKSETMKFAIYKLSNPDADKPDDKIVKKIISPLASMTTIAGASLGNPILSTGAFLGGSLMDIFSKSEKDLNYKYTKVNDADMIVLVRKIDDLQKDLVNLYCTYMTDRQVLFMEEQILEKRKRNYDSTQTSTREEILIADSFYRNSLDRVAKAQTKFLSTRSVLEQLVGTEAMKSFEKNLLSVETTK